MQRIPEAIQYIERASMMYVENGTPDTAALALDRAGKYVPVANIDHLRRSLKMNSLSTLACHCKRMMMLVVIPRFDA